MKIKNYKKIKFITKPKGFKSFVSHKYSSSLKYSKTAKPLSQFVGLWKDVDINAFLNSVKMARVDKIECEQFDLSCGFKVR